MAELYLDPMIIVVAVAIIMSVVGFFDLLPRGRRAGAEEAPITQ